MKAGLLVIFCLFSFSYSQAKVILSSDKEAQVHVARVVKLIDVEEQNDVQIKVAAHDLGGSTDLSPTQAIYLNLYLKGEMFSTDAAFKLSTAFTLKSVEVISPGQYKITILDFIYNEANKGFQDTVLTVDARKAIEEIQKVDCGFNFDCADSENFISEVILK